MGWSLPEGIGEPPHFAIWKRYFLVVPPPASGADVFVGDGDLTIRGVRAQALLLVDLDDVYHFVNRTLTFVDNRPEVVDRLGSTLQNTGAAWAEGSARCSAR